MTPRASGVGAVVAQRWSTLHNASPKAGLCWILLEAVRSEGNLGSLIRTSEAVGGAGFILAGPLIDPYSPAVVRASMAAVFRQAFIRTNDQSLRNWVRRHRCRVVGTAPAARRTSIDSVTPGRRFSLWARSVRGCPRPSATSARISSASPWSARPIR